MVWDYRVVKTKVHGEINYGIHETYYGNGAEEIPENASTEFLDGLGVSFQEHPTTVSIDDDEDWSRCLNDVNPRRQLRGVLLRMLAACDKPVIDGTAEGAEVGTYQLDTPLSSLNLK
jgi:hypothetical protein